MQINIKFFNNSFHLSKATLTLVLIMERERERERERELLFTRGIWGLICSYILHIVPSHHSLSTLLTALFLYCVE